MVKVLGNSHIKVSWFPPLKVYWSRLDTGVGCKGLIG
jgi:hypothetical protein